MFHQNGQNARSKSGRIAAHPAGLRGFRHVLSFSNRFMFCPAALSNPSIFTFAKPLSRKRLIPCHCLPSPNNGSTQTWRLRRAFLYASVSR